MEYSNGFVLNADAMSEEYINDKNIRKYIDNPNCTIIFFENPPYRDAVADNNKREKTGLEKSFVVEAFKKELPKLPNSNISTARDLSNQFIWTALKYYLRQEKES